jgi:hypothetical protein
MDKLSTNANTNSSSSASSFSDAADDEYLLRAVNSIEANDAAFSDISDEELCRFLNENTSASSQYSDRTTASPSNQQTALDLARFRDHWRAELIKSSRCDSPPPQSSPPLAQVAESFSSSPPLADEELANVLRQIEAYESRQFPCASPDEPIPSSSTYVEGLATSATSQSLKRPSSKGKKKAKKQALENGMYS